MDHRREEMASFYLNRERVQRGGLHGPPAFKAHSNPKMTHGHGLVVTKVELPKSSKSYINFSGSGSSRGSLSGSDSLGKKKRGRPRKYTPDESQSQPDIKLIGVPFSGFFSPKKNRGRPPGSGWKQRLANVGEWMNNSAGLAFTPHIIHVPVGEDVAEKILSFARQRPRALCILSGNGSVSAVTLSQFSSNESTVTYEGRFQILCLSGSYLPSENGGAQNRTGGLSISVSSSDGNVFGGAIGGSVVASSLVQVVVCSFVYGGNNVKTNTKSEAPSADKKSSDIQLNEARPIAVPWEPDSPDRLRNSPTEIDLTHG
uniref:AT-hook motif nuclear-localized protein 5-like n=1 Tax=Erigeron canadensis TaxID=72917 RepID=UPI001CB8E886|nr:AT-hook motif nuclear-localized protein 5-like [Erigeron canadensis]